MTRKKVCNKNWKSLPPTDKQVRFLKQYGENVPDTRGEACNLISKIIEELRPLEDLWLDVMYEDLHYGCD